MRLAGEGRRAGGAKAGMSRGGRHSDFPSSLNAIYEDWQSRRQGLLAALTDGAALAS